MNYKCIHINMLSCFWAQLSRSWGKPVFYRCCLILPTSPVTLNNTYIHIYIFIVLICFAAAGCTSDAFHLHHSMRQFWGSVCGQRVSTTRTATTPAVEQELQRWWAVSLASFETIWLSISPGLTVPNTILTKHIKTLPTRLPAFPHFLP